MKFHKIKKLWLVILVLAGCVFYGCSIPISTQRMKGHIIYYKEFNMFNLSGEDTLLESKFSKTNREYVRVRYSNQLPDNIKYYYPKRTVEFVLADSFVANGKHVYIYSTENLLGGKPGSQIEYSLRRIRNMYMLYVNLSDTLIVKYFDAIDAQSESYYYQVSVYIRKANDSIINKSLASENTKTVNGISQENLYQGWYKKSNSPHKDAIIVYKKFPPE